MGALTASQGAHFPHLTKGIFMIHIIYLLFIAVILGLYLRDYFEMKKRVKDADAREQGLDEIEQGYQAEIMDLEDKVHNVRQSHWLEKEQHIQTINDYDTQIAELQQRELHSQEQIVQLKARLDDAQQAGLEMQQRLEKNALADLGDMYEEISFTD